MTDSPKATTVRRRRYWLIGSGFLGLALLGLAPLLLSTVFRDRVLAYAMDDPELKISSRSAVFGWFSGARVDGLTVTSTDGRLKLEIGTIEFKQSFLRLLMNDGDLGSITLQRPSLNVDLTEEEVDALMNSPSDPGGPTLNASIEQGDVSIRIAGDSAIELHGFDATIEIAREANNRIVVAKLQRLLDHRPLSPELSAECVKWIDPMLADVVEANGSVSLSIDQLKVPLDVSNDESLAGLVLEGTLGLHDVAVATKTPILSVVLRLANDAKGQGTSDTIRIFRDAKVKFHVSEGRIHHEGDFSGVLEQEAKIPLKSYGSIGFDESLDVKLEVPTSLLKEDLVSGSSVGETQTITVRGNLSNPIVHHPEPTK